MTWNGLQRRSPIRGLLETALLGAVPLLSLLAISPELPVNILTLGMLYIGLACALWYTLRLKIPAGSFWQVALYELLNAAALGFVTLVILQLATVPFDLWAVGQGDAPPGFGFIPLTGSIPTFLGLRILQYGWFFWDRMRKQKILWSMVHSQLIVVTLLVLLLTLIGAVGITIQANPQYSETSLAATFTHRIVLTILPFLAISTLALVTALAGILPPAALASYLFSRRITQRLESLAQSAKAIQDGDYTSRVIINGEDEIASLQAGFNAMTADLERTLNELQSERDKVTALLASRRTLTASVSHELRTPLATILSYLEPLLEEPTRTSTEDLVIMERELVRLGRLIDDLFTLSRAESGGLELKLSPTDVTPLAQRMVDMYAQLAWRSGKVEVVCQVMSEQTTGLVDPGRLEQIIANLLRNAIRHTPPGGIVALVVSSEYEWVKIEIRDTGSGIPPDHLPHIWEPFYWVGRDGSQHGSGAGLGLTLVKDLTEAMGGTVSVESTLGIGSTFSITFPQS